MMWRIKKLADPHGVLAPNVILTRDDGINLKSFKSAPPIEDNRNSLHRMRLLRGGLPQPQHHRYPAAADRAAPGDGPPGRRVAPARPAAG